MSYSKASVQATLRSDTVGRVVATIAHNGAQATVTASGHEAALRDLEEAVQSAFTHGQGECFWNEAMVVYRWLFRREGNVMRVVIIQSAGTLTGWEHCLWVECDPEEFREAMLSGIAGYSQLEPQL